MNTKERLEYLRGELRAERISWGELHELQSLADEIDPGDVELLEAAGVPEQAYSPEEAAKYDERDAFPWLTNEEYENQKADRS
jgi:hypothetical protein